MMDADDFSNVSMCDDMNDRPVQLNQSMLGASVILDGRPSFFNRGKERNSELPGQGVKLLGRASGNDFDLETFAPNEDQSKGLSPRFSGVGHDKFGGIQISPNEDYKKMTELFVGEPFWIKSESM
jgi:hypothetical protein